MIGVVNLKDFGGLENSEEDDILEKQFLNYFVNNAVAKHKKEVEEQNIAR